MAGGVNIKMGVSGVSQFKQNIAAAKNSLKTLDAQLSLNEKQFKATGDAEAYMQEKSELLKAKLEEQKAVVAQAEKALAEMNANGVDKASKAFQDMQQQMLRAKGELLDTQTQLANVGEAGDTAGDNISEMNAQLKRIGDGVDFQNLKEGLSDIGSSIGGLIQKAWQLGQALVNATLGSGAWADELAATADQYQDTLEAFGGEGKAAETLQRMRKTARKIDTEADTILDSMDKLKKGREEQSEDYMGALAYLGIDPTGKDDLSLFWEAGEAIAKLGKNEDKVHYAQKLFGKSWRDLLPLFKAGREEYEETMASQSVVSDESLERLQKMDDQLQDMQNEWETTKNELLSEIAPAIETVMGMLTELLKEFNAYLQTEDGKKMMQDLREAITGLFEDITKIDPKAVIEGIKGAIEGVVKAFRWIKENWHGIVDAIKFIAIGFGGLKLGGLALNLVSIVKSLGGLGAGKVAADATGATAALAGTGAAKGGLFAKIGGGLKAAGGFLASAAPFIGADVAVITAAIMPAVLAQKADERRWMAEQQERDDMAQKALELGMVNEAAFIKNAAEVLGPKRNADGSYQRDFTGLFLNMNPGDMRSAAMGLKDRNDQQKAELYNSIMRYAPETSGGWTTWGLLNRMWEKDDLDAVEENELLTALAQAQMLEVQAKQDRMAREAEQMEINRKQSENNNTQTDILKGLPKDIADAIQGGMANVRIYIDGYEAGRVLTPQINGNLAGVLSGFVK